MNTDMFSRTMNKTSHTLESHTKQNIGYLTGILQECIQQSKIGEDYVALANKYKHTLAGQTRKLENSFLKDLPEDEREVLVREIDRVFDCEPQAISFKSKIRRLINWRLEELKRETKEVKWSLAMTMLKTLLLKNRQSRDLFEMFRGIDLPNEFRQEVWKYFLENLEIADEYKKQVSENRILTISKYDLQIGRDVENFVIKFTDPDEFDGSMMVCQKTTLSYYEVKKDRVLSDYLHLLAIPLMVVYKDMRHLQKFPAEIIGYYFSLQKMVKEFDPLVDLVIKHDEIYDQEMTELFMSALQNINSDISDHIKANLLRLDLPSQRTLLVLLVKKFVHSLGFQFLSLPITIFIWDQLIMKVKRVRSEIFYVMAISFFCLRIEILECKNWDEVLNAYYCKAKLIPYADFVQIYLDFFNNKPFYFPKYEIAEGININKNMDDIGRYSKSIPNKLEDSLILTVNPPAKGRTKVLQPRFIEMNENEENLRKTKQSYYEPIELNQTSLDNEIKQNLKYDLKMGKYGILPKGSYYEDSKNFDVFEDF